MANIRMRAYFLGILIAGAACWAISDTANADTFTIGAFSEDRTGLSNVSSQKRPFLGPNVGGSDYYDSIRAALDDPNALLDPTGGSYSWPDGNDNNEIDVQISTPANAIDDARGGALDGLDLLIMSEVKPLVGTLAEQQAEYDAIADFVRRGGCLVLVVDSQYTQLSGTTYVNDPSVIQMANDVLDALDTTNAGRAGSINGTSPSEWPIGQYGHFEDWSANSELVHGRFPYFSDGTGWDVTNGPTDPEATDPEAGPLLSVTYNSIVVPGEWSHEIAWRNEQVTSSYFAMEIQPHTITETAGAVMVVGDTVFSEFFVDPGAGSNQNVNNGTLLLNFVAQQMTMPEIPEPSVLAMLTSGGLLAACWAVRRRRRKAA